MLNADFVYDPTTVTFGNSITFTDQSAGDVISWNWTFEGGIPGTSTDTVVVVEYPTVGTYLATLVVSDGTDISTKIQTVYVVEPGAPVPNFVADTTVIMVGESVNFLDLTTDGPDSWSWTFQGGTPVSSTDQNPTNIVYNNPGEYDVFLSSNNIWGTAHHTKFSYIKVLAEEPPVEVCDTISNFDPMDALVVENVTAGGILPGVNGLNISEYAEMYDNTNLLFDKVNGVRAWVHIASAASSSSSVRFKIWTGSNAPTTLLGYKDVDIQNMSPNFVHTVYFDNPIDITGETKFFVGYNISAVGSDQFAVSIADDRGPGGLATMYMFYNNTWYPAADMSAVDFIHTSLGVEPIACNTTEIEEFEYVADEITVFPNPTSDLINISFGSNPPKDYQIKVFDIMGNLVNVAQSLTHGSLAQIDFANNANGIYFVSMIMNDKVVTKKILLSR